MKKISAALTAVLLIFSAVSCSDISNSYNSSDKKSGGLTDTDFIAADAAALSADDFIYTAGDSPVSVTGNFTMPAAGANGTVITWTEKTDAGNSVTLSGTENSSANVTWQE
jgi:hypothetical protein